MFPVLGKPLMWYTLKKIVDMEVEDKTLVITDDNEIERYARSFGVMVCREPPVVNENSTGALKFGLEWATSIGLCCDVVVCLEVTSPCWTPGQLEAACTRVAHETGELTCSVVRSEPLAFQGRLDENGVFSLFEPLDLSQNLLPVYKFSGCVFAFPAAMLRERDCSTGKTFYDGLCMRGIVHNDPYVDIDEMEHMLWLEVMLRSGRYPSLYREEL
jgi:CMP-N-acetylneuraminic acid synthetase